MNRRAILRMSLRDKDNPKQPFSSIRISNVDLQPLELTSQQQQYPHNHRTTQYQQENLPPTLGVVPGDLTGVAVDQHLIRLGPILIRQQPSGRGLG